MWSLEFDMRVVGVVTKLGVEPGLYARRGVPEGELVSQWNSMSNAARLGVGLAGLVAVWYWPISYGVYLVYEYLTKDGPGRIYRVEQAALPSSNESTALLPSRVIFLPSSALLQTYSDYGDPVFHGLFDSAKLLRTLMSAEGGHSELLIVDQAMANATYRHAGGGRFSTGLHLPHPKDPAVLVPVRDFSEYMGVELRAEWVRIFEALGAKRIVIADSTKVSGKANAKVANPTGNVAAEMRATYGSSNVEESTYESGTFDPKRAATDRRWLGDHPEIVSIIEGRIGGRQSSWRRTIKVDCTFGASAEFLSLATATKGSASFEVEYHRTYDFFVEFFPKT
jgi:hypothetical protein